MKILESWEDNQGQAFAIVEHSRQTRERFSSKQFEALWATTWDGELWSFGGGPGLEAAEFNTVGEARDFVLAGIEGQQANPEIWLDMVSLSRDRVAG